MTQNHATLTVNLSAIVANYELLSKRHAKKTVAAVVKADAYGLGVEAVSRALWQAGVRDFFVATLAESIELRTVLPKAKIRVFQGLLVGEEQEYADYKLNPILNDLGQVERFIKHDKLREAGELAIHIDTGMTRLGLCESELQKLQSIASPTLIISHLACANDPQHQKNAEQLQRFRTALAYFPVAKGSFANSSGLFLPPEFHFDMARPGCALYGINPVDGENPMQPVAILSAPILQIRRLDRDENIGYGATYAAQKGSKIAIVAFGYADGYFRSLSNQGFAYLADYKVPIVGRVSMDMVTIDVSEIPDEILGKAKTAEFINKKQTVDDIATQCNTIGYEIFTRIGKRVKREYK